MASIYTHKHGIKAGCKYVRFFRNKKPCMVYLGRVSDRFAQTVKLHVEELLSTKAGGMAPAPATAKWITTIDPALSQKLADAGLIDEAADDSPAATLDAFITDYIDKLNIKPGTRWNLNIARRNLVEFFGDDRPLK